LNFGPRWEGKAPAEPQAERAEPNHRDGNSEAGTRRRTNFNNGG